MSYQSSALSRRHSPTPLRPSSRFSITSIRIMQTDEKIKFLDPAGARDDTAKIRSISAKRSAILCIHPVIAVSFARDSDFSGLSAFPFIQMPSLGVLDYKESSIIRNYFVYTRERYRREKCSIFLRRSARRALSPTWRGSRNGPSKSLTGYLAK